MTAPILGRKAEGEGIWFQTKPLRQVPISTHPRSHVGGSFFKIIEEFGALFISRKALKLCWWWLHPQGPCGKLEMSPLKKQILGMGCTEPRQWSHVPVDAHLMNPSPRQGSTPAMHSPVLLVPRCPVPYTRQGQAECQQNSCLPQTC